MEVNAALGTAVIFSIFGQYVVTLVFTFMAGLMSKADKAAAEANPKGIAQVNYISMVILGTPVSYTHLIIITVTIFLNGGNRLSTLTA